MTNEKLAKYLKIALSQRARRAALAEKDYGTAHAVTAALSDEIIELRNTINDLEHGKPLELADTRKPK